ncbi:MoaD/ThiS family protein [Phycicoccus sp. Soil748]|uniref:MoaD/ThiS family protein n=1 Tax=Intrasporangiaceae TaxID=85021 RepID=UPI000ACECE92|nr:MoaD/ThiS family protein [Phycicoccus sp. Soil748]
MGTPSDRAVGAVTIRYWAGARAAAGVEQDELTDVTTVGAALAAVVALHPPLEPVAAVSTLLLDGRSVDREAPLTGGSVLEVLPPFAGG